MKLYKTLSALSLCVALPLTIYSQQVKWGAKHTKISEGLSYLKTNNGKLYLMPVGGEPYEVGDDLVGTTRKSAEAAGVEKWAFTDEYDKKTKTLSLAYNGQEIAQGVDVGHCFLGWLGASKVFEKGNLGTGREPFYGGQGIIGAAVGNFKGASRNTILSTNYDYKAFGEYWQMSLFYSPDKSKSILVYRKAPASKNDNVNKDVFVLKQLDANYKVVAETELTMPYTEVQIAFNAFGITDEGQVFYLAKHFLDKEKYEAIVGQVDMKAGKWGKEIPVDTKGKWLKTVSISVLGNNRLLINGLTTDDPDNKGITFTGTLATQVDLATGKAEVQTHALPEVLFTWEKESKNYEPGGGVPPRLYIVQSINLEEDGISYLICVNMGYLGSGDNPKVTTHSEGIVLLKTDYDGNLIFSRKINRKIIETGPARAGGMLLHRYKDDYYVVYCIGKDMVDLNPDTEPEKTYIKSGGFVMACTRIGADGKDFETTVVSDELTPDQIPFFGTMTATDNKIYLVEAKNSQVYAYNFGLQLAQDVKLGCITLK